MNSSDLLTTASIIAGFGVTVLMFRLQRELQISDENWRLRREGRESRIIQTWIPPADYLVILAIIVSLLGSVLPTLVSGNAVRLASAACAAATILLAGYVPSILAHYRFIYGLHKSRGPFLFWEWLFVGVTFLAAGATFYIVWNRNL
jgi:hypothetical protein